MKHTCPKRDDGLACCEVCGGAESSLTTDCCGRPLTQAEQDFISAGMLNYTAADGWCNSAGPREKCTVCGGDEPCSHNFDRENRQLEEIGRKMGMEVPEKFKPPHRVFIVCWSNPGGFGELEVEARGASEAALLAEVANVCPEDIDVIQVKLPKPVDQLAQYAARQAAKKILDLNYPPGRAVDNMARIILRYIKEVKERPNKEALAYIAALWRNNQLPSPMSESLREAVLGYTCGVTEKKS